MRAHQGGAIKIQLTHPALAGHFPGNPIVPGVVILDEVAHALPRFLGEQITIVGFPTVKFIAPLAPEQEFSVAFTRKGENQVSFEVSAQGGKIVTGSITYKYPDPPSA